LGFGDWSSRKIDMSYPPEIATSRWPHRWAVALACATFPLVWVGGLVTTTDSGMAVPDWPTTYGYNLFLYPLSTWLAGPWDIFVEHGHRLLGATVGILTIGLLLTLWRSEKRWWMRWLGMAALVLVVSQGVLGGMRVRYDLRELAMFHGTTGPLFFAISVAMAVFTSSRWQRADTNVAHRQIPLLAVVTCILIYLQIVLGAVLRHVPVDSEPAAFAVAARFHLVMAAIVSLHILALVWLVWSRARSIRPLGGLAATLIGLLGLQLLLGASTWIIKFASPTWAPSWVTSARGAVQQGGWLQTHVITAHVAVGSLMLATSLALALYAVKRFASRTAAVMPVRKLEAAV
jgi:cytochrome c oxidase assembly protein subunit 15